MNYKNTIRHGISSVLIFGAISLGMAAIASAQTKSVAKKKPSADKSGPRDPFKKYEVIVKSNNSKLDVPSIQMRIERYRAAVRCVVRAGAANRFGAYAPLQGGEEAVFRRMLAPVVASAKK